MGLDTSRNPFQACPAYAALASLPLEQRVAAMRRPDRRARILAESEAAGRTGRQRDFDWVFPLRCLAD
jgi:N-acyl-D-amino-acid deacylase